MAKAQSNPPVIVEDAPVAPTVEPAVQPTVVSPKAGTAPGVPVIPTAAVVDLNGFKVVHR